MALSVVWTSFEQALDSQSAHILGFAAAKTITASSDFSFRDECLLEGLLSRVWQTWNDFCRRCVIESCLGTTSANGAAVAGLPNAASARLRCGNQCEENADWTLLGNTQY